jgi:hypothetical protein
MFCATSNMDYIGEQVLVNTPYVTVPVEATVYPLCVISDIGGEPNVYFVIFPKQNRSQFFGDKI